MSASWVSSVGTMCGGSRVVAGPLRGGGPVVGETATAGKDVCVVLGVEDP